MLVVATAALAQLAAVGRSHLTAATDKSIAAYVARNQLQRLAAGIDPVTETPRQRLAEDPRWEVRIEILPVAAAPGLVEVEVSVRRATNLAGGARADDNERWYSVTQWMRGSEDLHAGLGL